MTLIDWAVKPELSQNYSLYNVVTDLCTIFYNELQISIGSVCL